MANFIYMLIENLSLDDLYKVGYYDRVGRWYPIPEIAHYFVGIREPSYRWPHSYERAAMTHKFAGWLVETHPEIANRIFQSSEMIFHIHENAELSRRFQEYEEAQNQPWISERENLTRLTFYEEGEDDREYARDSGL
jgi:hypothetical protein